MLSYIVGILVAAIFLVNPISQMLFGGQRQSQQNLHHRRPSASLSPRPQLNESMLALDGPHDAGPQCPPAAYVARILRREPLVVYLEGFLSDEERKHLLDIR